MEFTIINNRSLAARIKGIVNTAEQRRENYWNVLFNCVNRSFEHNDVSWVNRGLEAARAEGRYRATLAILKQVVPFGFDKSTQQFGGKRKLAMYNKLKDNYAEVLMALITQQQERDSKASEPQAYDFYKALGNFLSKAHKHDVTDAEIIEAIREAAKQAA